MKYQSFCVKLKSSRLSHLGTISSDGQIKRSWILDGQVSIRAKMKIQCICLQKNWENGHFTAFSFWPSFQVLKNTLRKLLSLNSPNPIKFNNNFQKIKGIKIHIYHKVNNIHIYPLVEVQYWGKERC